MQKETAHRGRTVEPNNIEKPSIPHHSPPKRRDFPLPFIASLSLPDPSFKKINLASKRPLTILADESNQSAVSGQVQTGSVL